MKPCSDKEMMQKAQPKRPNPKKTKGGAMLKKMIAVSRKEK